MNSSTMVTDRPQLVIAIDQCVERLLAGVAYDENGDPYDTNSSILRRVKEEMQKTIGEAVTKIADDQMLPIIRDGIEGVVIQETNVYGEAKGKPRTFIEYLVDRAEIYMTEKVDHAGKSKSEAGGYSWNGTQTRITHLIHAHLQYHISTAIANALKEMNQKVGVALADTIKLQLAETLNKLKVNVST